MSSVIRRLLAACLIALTPLIGIAPALAAGSDAKPTLYLIGDSTVKNRTRNQLGWGTPLADHLNTARITLENRALGGRSSRSYLREGLWAAVVRELKPGDIVMIQFGHNDGGPLADGKARASLKGAGEESKDVVLTESGQPETVRTYGWYIRNYAREAKAKGAKVIVCSPVPRNIWKDGKVARASNDYGKWAREAAEAEGVHFFDLNEVVAKAYEELGPEEVLARYFTAADHTHTNEAGARFTAARVAAGLRDLRDSPLAEFIVEPIPAPTAGVSQ
jgi:lysophospholipase L1-like esterase